MDGPASKGGRGYHVNIRPGLGKLREGRKMGLTTKARNITCERHRSLQGCVCPACRTAKKAGRSLGILNYRGDGINRCDRCGLELVTEWEWRNRQ